MQTTPTGPSNISLQSPSVLSRSVERLRWMRMGSWIHVGGMLWFLFDLVLSEFLWYFRFVFLSSCGLSRSTFRLSLLSHRLPRPDWLHLVSVNLPFLGYEICLFSSCVSSSSSSCLPPCAFWTWLFCGFWPMSDLFACLEAFLSLFSWLIFFLLLFFCQTTVTVTSFPFYMLLEISLQVTCALYTSAGPGCKLWVMC